MKKWFLAGLAAAIALIGVSTAQAQPRFSKKDPAAKLEKIEADLQKLVDQLKEAKSRFKGKEGKGQEAEKKSAKRPESRRGPHPFGAPKGLAKGKGRGPGQFGRPKEVAKGKEHERGHFRGPRGKGRGHFAWGAGWGHQRHWAGRPGERRTGPEARSSIEQRLDRIEKALAELRQGHRGPAPKAGERKGPERKAPAKPAERGRSRSEAKPTTEQRLEKLEKGIQELTKSRR